MKHFKLLVLAFALSPSLGCESTSENEDLARCDRIANKKVTFFADQDNQGSVRQLFLSGCVLGPDKTYTDHGKEWVECMDTAVTGAEMSNCQKVFDYRLKQDKLNEIQETIEKGFKAYLCENAGKDAVNDIETRISALSREARELGASESEIPTIEEFAEEVSKKGDKFCK